MNNQVIFLLKQGKSIVPALVEIGIHSYRPFEAMTDEVTQVHRRFASYVHNRNELAEYMAEELARAKKAYTERIKEFY